jgi:outer membrane protein OmpA-like peptidoglycan-associated protein
MKIMKYVLLVTSCSLVALGCSSSEKRHTTTTADNTYLGTDKARVDTNRDNDARVAANNTAEVKRFARVAKIDFAKGSNMLSTSEKAELDSLVKNAREHGKIDEIKILAWADADYSAEGVKAPSKEVNLADARARAVRTYIRERLSIKDIDTHNMAKRPGAMAKLFKTDDYELKTGRYDIEGNFFKPVSSPQEVVVLVEMDNDRD